MDHSHRDRTYKKSRFQQELEQSVSRKLISSLLLGCLLFCMYRVLLVEDEEIIRKGIRYSVPWEECGCSVVGEAENGAVGEEKIAELQPDIVITDITMPVKNGLEMIADTREKFNYIAIILTGYSEFEYAQQAIRNGVSDYLLKPLDMDEMRTALEKAVRLAGDNQYLQQREDKAEAVRSRTALPPLSEDKVTDPLVLRIVAYKEICLYEPNAFASHLILYLYKLRTKS